jgi:hypothetical protein
MQRIDLVGDRFLRKEAEMPREIYRIVVGGGGDREMDRRIVVTLHHFLCIHFPSASLSNSLCIHSTNCITTFCSALHTKKNDEEATPANFP